MFDIEQSPLALVVQLTAGLTAEPFTPFTSVKSVKTAPWSAAGVEASSCLWIEIEPRLAFVKVQVVFWPARMVMFPGVPWSQVDDVKSQPVVEPSLTQ
jgi:hypothetical protein